MLIVTKLDWLAEAQSHHFSSYIHCGPAFFVFKYDFICVNHELHLVLNENYHLTVVCLRQSDKSQLHPCQSSCICSHDDASNMDGNMDPFVFLSYGVQKQPEN